MKKKSSQSQKKAFKTPSKQSMRSKSNLLFEEEKAEKKVEENPSKAKFPENECKTQQTRTALLLAQLSSSQLEFEKSNQRVFALQVLQICFCFGKK